MLGRYRLSERLARQQATRHTGRMTIEIGGFIALAALMVGLFAWLRQDISALHVRVSNLEARMDTQMSDLRERMDTQNSDLRERMAKLEGLLEGLRESITGRHVA